MTDPFLRIWTKYGADGVVRISWELNELFSDPFPHEFLLEGQIAAPRSADDWQTIGTSAQDVFQLEDSADRHLGMYQDFRYRVKLVTPTGVYYSRSVGRPDPLSFRDWRISRDMVRKERLRHQLFTSLRGWLFRRRRGGPRCPRCVNEVDTGPTDDRCEDCLGTGYDRGYFPPQYAEMQLEVHAVQGQVDPAKIRGTVEDRIIQGARMLGDPYPYAQDVFVDGRTNLRYIIQNTQEAAIIRDYPVVTLVTAKVANQGDITYSLLIPDLPEIDRDGLNPDAVQEDQAWPILAPRRVRPTRSA